MSIFDVVRKEKTNLEKFKNLHARFIATLKWISKNKIDTAIKKRFFDLEREMDSSWLELPEETRRKFL